MPKRETKGNLMIKFIENGNKNETVRNVIKTSLEHKKIPSVESYRTLNVTEIVLSSTSLIEDLKLFMTRIQ
jgi:hypothetical protein